MRLLLGFQGMEGVGWFSLMGFWCSNGEDMNGKSFSHTLSRVYGVRPKWVGLWA